MSEDFEYQFIIPYHQENIQQIHDLSNPPSSHIYTHRYIRRLRRMEAAENPIKGYQN